jgi:O-acetyl-ADP-ribose deacetylase (regulator of RNase III)
MIRYARGNVLDSDAEALINTVNEVGVMGKGVALQFRERYPANAAAYELAAKRGEIRVGRMFVVRDIGLTGPKWIVNFPTKRHWRQPSQIAWIQEGLKDLVKVVEERGIRSVALPPLGCGNGRLQWGAVRAEIEAGLSGTVGVDVAVYLPTDAYYGMSKRAGTEALTPARALVVELVRRYSTLGIECTNLEIQKLAWFLTRAIHMRGLSDPLKLTFSANKYGPYADGLRHLLDSLDGSYLHCGKRLSDAGPYDSIWFDETRRAELQTYLRSADVRAYLPALECAAAVIDGFESPLGMELLSTVDWIVSRQHVNMNVEAVGAALAQWPGGASAARRKQAIFDPRLIGLAVERLELLPS